MATPNKARLRMWVKALKSGQYQQGNGYLRDSDNKYCCLGVAMDIAFANGAKARHNEYWGGKSLLPTAVCDFYGINHRDAEVALSEPGKGRGPVIAARLNDEGVPFNVIADRIVHTYGLDQED